MISPTRLQALILSVGVHKQQRPLSPVEVGEALTELLTSKSLAEVSALLSCESTTLRKFMKLTELPEAVRHAIDWGSSKTTLSFSAAAELARLEPADQQTVADAALAHRMTKDEVRQVVQIRLRSGASAADAVQQVLRLRPEIVRVHVYFGALRDEALREQLALLAQADRDALLTRVVRAALPRLPDASARLTRIGFSLATSRSLDTSETASLETRIESGLRKALPEQA